ncbi:4-amino-4-deoxy-L-arabinose transferase [Mucilaginibacter mallensis]|uniref:4-amino-4-deoxy-L-arabinose transferase n=1 Tax=Mucilaginibacter mallensis TaxID=652787 RepID=A0A1H1RZ78_MUCMA|nr:glycosyltransferase family 39 protein [Mucilaginibacter mallensis]SDS41057.1 4-amino-4-deoxy-L-arabinose transferase [Mucilaginibacter mallensis]
MGETVPANQLKWLCFFIAMAVAVNFSGLFVTLIAPDATLYATIAKTMVLHHNYADIIVNGNDWLDKPHFPFWVTALFFNVFGISTWAYKLPGILFLLMGAIYTYRFAKELYNQQVAQWSVLILLTAEHIIISNNDVRAEPYLTGLIIASVYHFYRAYTRNNFWQLLLGSLFTACAIMTKGMFAIVPIGGAIVGQFIITKQWKQLFAWRWLIAIALVLIFIIPELYCLYRQFDIHPEKVIFGQKGVSGIKFFFWDSQFGRFFNTGPIKGGGDPFFFVHTTLWAFLPWSLLFFVSIFRFIKTGVKNVQGQEWYCISGALLTFLLFSASKFQLPYYMNIVFPFFAIITAQYLYSVSGTKSIKAIRITQAIVIVLMLVVVCALQYFFVPDSFTWPVILLISIVFLLMLFLPGRLNNITMQAVIVRTVLAAVVVNLYINLAFYPSLMKYQAGSQAARWINWHNPQKYPVVQCDESNWPMEFYLNQPLIAMNPDTIKIPPVNTFMLYAKTDIVNGLVAKGWHVQVVAGFKTYWVSRLKPKFLNVKTRDKELIGMEVVVVNGR